MKCGWCLLVLMMMLTAAGQKPPAKEEAPAPSVSLRAVEEESVPPPQQVESAEDGPAAEEEDARATEVEEQSAEELSILRRDQPRAGQTDGRPLVVSLIAPYQGLVEQLAGDRFQVASLLVPGEDLHELQLRGSVLWLLSRTDIYLKMGLAQEESLILPQLPPGAEVVDLTAVVDSFYAGFVALADLGSNIVSYHDPADGNDLDVHYWLGPDQVLQQLPLISQSLRAFDPAGEEEYQRRLEELQREVERVSSRVTALLAPLTGQLIPQYHPFLQYFLNNFSLLGLGVEREGREVSLADVERLRQQQRRIGIRSLFIAEGDGSRYPQLLADRLGWRLVELDIFSRQWSEAVEGIAQALYGEYLYWQNQWEDER